MRRLTKIAIAAQHEVVSLANGQPHVQFHPLLLDSNMGRHGLGASASHRCAGVQVCTRHARQSKPTHSDWGLLSTWAQHLSEGLLAHQQDGSMAPWLPHSLLKSVLAPHDSRTRPNGRRPKIHISYLQCKNRHRQSNEWLLPVSEVHLEQYIDHQHH